MDFRNVFLSLYQPSSYQTYCSKDYQTCHLAWRTTLPPPVWKSKHPPPPPAWYLCLPGTNELLINLNEVLINPKPRCEYVRTVGQTVGRTDRQAYYCYRYLALSWLATCVMAIVVVFLNRNWFKVILIPLCPLFHRSLKVDVHQQRYFTVMH